MACLRYFFAEEHKMDYFYKSESETYAFYRVPKLLFTHIFYKDLSCVAKLLYGMLVDRMTLSDRNFWRDREGNTYIYFSIETIMRSLNCAHGKTEKLLASLEDYGLLDRRRQGLGKPSRLYPQPFAREM